MRRWDKQPIVKFVNNGQIELGRGNIISKIDIQKFPGSYPIYSSSAKGDGKLGEYGNYMFDEELITWSVDGGGNLFYRPKHKFSVTNVCGYIRLHSSEIDYRFLHYLLSYQHSLLNFDYQTKAHPSVVKKLYYFVQLPIEEQHRIADILSTLDDAIAQSEALVRKYQSIKQGLMFDLLTRGVDENGELRLPREEAPELYGQTSLGCLPKEWEVLKIRNARKSITSGSRWWAKNYSEEGALFLRIGNLTREHINLRFESIQRVHVPNDAESKRTAVAAGDVLVSVTADLGIIAVIPENFEEAYVNQHIALIKIDDGVTTSRWVGHYLASHVGQYQFQEKNDSGAKAGLNLPTVDSLSFANPLKGEREKIVEILDNHDKMIQVERENLTKFLMLKQGLMQDLLSGQVRVENLI